MTRKVTRNNSLIVVAVSVAILALLIAAAVLAQTRGAGQVSGRNRFGDHAMDSGPLLFMPAVAYGSGGYTAHYVSSIAVGDVNGDGKLDLVVGNQCASSDCEESSQGLVSVLLGNGDGTFQPAVVYGSGGGAPTPTSVAVADVNGDGIPDLLVANWCGDANCDGTVSVLLGKGDGTFQAAVTYSSGGRYAQSVAVADVNHDGKPDVIVANDCAGSCSKNTGGVAVLLGNGDGTFRTAVSYDSGGYDANSVAVADVNEDGNLDLEVSNLSDTVGVLLGNGDGTFQPAVNYSSDPGTPASVAVSVGVADVNGDGKPDLLVVNQSVGGNGNNEGAVAVLLGNGDGTFRAAVNYISGGYLASAVAVGDVNGDGRPDLVVANSCSNNNNGGGTDEAAGSVGVLLNNVGAPPTTTTLVSSVNPAAINWVATYTAAVTSQSGGVLNGTVTFEDGAAPFATVTLANSQAAYSMTYVAKGTHSITAIYSGELNNAAGSTSAVLTEIILKPRPAKTQVTTSGSPSFVGQPVTFPATATSAYGAIPDGDLVTFYDGTTVIGTSATASGVATLTTSLLTARAQTITATYAGDANFKPSSGSVKQVVDKYPTTTTLTSSPNPSAYRQAVTFTAIGASAGPTPTGKVTFKDGATAIGTVALSGGVAKLTKSTLAVGTHPITAQYLGDGASAKSTSSVLDQVVK